MTDPEIKAGRRHSASDDAIIKALRTDMKAFALKQMGDVDDFAGKMSDYLKALGYEDEDGDGEVTPDEAEAQVGEDEDAPPFAGKALDYASRCELVCAAVREAIDEVGVWDDEEDDDALGDMAGPVRQIAGDYKAHAANELITLVYDKEAIAMVGPVSWRIPYAIVGGAVELATPNTWARVEAEWKPVAGAAPMEAPSEGIPGGAVKMLADGTIVAQAVRFGSSDEPDMSAYSDYFTKATDFWLGQWDKRPMLYHHAMDEGTKDAPVIGAWVKAWADDAGIWLQGQLDKAHKYHAAIKELARRGLLRISTDSAPHLVQRVRQTNGTHEVKTWPILAASLTVSPAEPRLIPAELKTTLAALGLSIDTPSPEAPTPTDAERCDSTKGDEDAVRRLALELTLIELEYIPL